MHNTKSLNKLIRFFERDAKFFTYIEAHTIGVLPCRDVIAYLDRSKKGEWPFMGYDLKGKKIYSKFIKIN